MNILLRKWLDLFIIVRSRNTTFKFGKIFMNIEIEDSRTQKYFVNVEDVEFDLLTSIENKRDLARMFTEFEIEMNDFISLNKYESLENVIFTQKAKNLMYKEIGNTTYTPLRIWINNKWSDHIFDK